MQKMQQNILTKAIVKRKFKTGERNKVRRRREKKEYKIKIS